MSVKKDSNSNFINVPESSTLLALFNTDMSNDFTFVFKPAFSNITLFKKIPKTEKSNYIQLVKFCQSNSKKCLPFQLVANQNFH
jgi:hypothetical protein